MRSSRARNRVIDLSTFALDPDAYIITAAPMSSKRRPAKWKNFAIVPLSDDWGYRVMTVAGRGAAIVLYVLREQRAKEYQSNGVPITATMLRRFGIDRKIRTSTINRLVTAGLATVRRRGKYRGCPALILNIPANE